MKFYTKQHQFYCGMDLHPRTAFGGVPIDTGGLMSVRVPASTLRVRALLGGD